MAAVLAAVLLAPAPLAAGQVLDLAVATRGGAVTVSLSFRWDRMPEVVDTLRQGLESRITFTLRLYEQRRGIFPLFGDRLLAEKTVMRSAFWDFLDGKFVIETDTEVPRTFPTAPELMQHFFTLSDVVLSGAFGGGAHVLYVSARAQLEPVRLQPPLTIVSMVGKAATYTTPWVRRNAP